MAVAGTIPTVARDFICFTNAASRKHDCFGAKDSEPTALAIVTESADDPFAVFQQCDNAQFHVHIDPLMNAVIL